MHTGWGVTEDCLPALSSLVLIDNYNGSLRMWGVECWLPSACRFIKNRRKWTTLFNFTWVETWTSCSGLANPGLRVQAYSFLSICFLLPWFWNPIPRSGHLTGLRFHHLPLSRFSVADLFSDHVLGESHWVLKACSHHLCSDPPSEPSSAVRNQACWTSLLTAVSFGQADPAGENWLD